MTADIGTKQTVIIVTRFSPTSSSHTSTHVNRFQYQQQLCNGRWNQGADVDTSDMTHCQMYFYRCKCFWAYSPRHSHLFTNRLTSLVPLFIHNSQSHFTLSVYLSISNTSPSNALVLLVTTRHLVHSAHSPPSLSSLVSTNLLQEPHTHIHTHTHCHHHTLLDEPE